MNELLQLNTSMKLGATKPKRHHYVPRFYLERFADSSGYLHIYDRISHQWRRQKPNNVMHCRNYYYQEWAPAHIDPNILEKTLGHWLEKEAAQAIDTIIQSPNDLSEKEIVTFLLYLELQRIRVPRQAELAKTLMRKTILDIVPEETAVAIQDGEFLLAMNDSARFDYMRMMCGQLHPWFARMEWEVIEAESGSAFITTDSPVSLYNSDCTPPVEAGIALAGTIVFFPLSSRYLLLMRHSEFRLNPSISRLKIISDPKPGNKSISITHGAVWSSEVVKRLNWKLIQLSERLAVGESENAFHDLISN